jgi:hypothetical protein
MKKTRIKVDERTSSLLAAIAAAEDDPFLIAELAQVDPSEFREFIAESESIGEEAQELLNAAESSPADDTTMQQTIGHYDTGGGGTLLAGLTDPGVFVNRFAPFRLLLTLYLGMFLSLAYGVLDSALVFYLRSESEAQLFWIAYTTSFKTIFSLGLILGTTLFVYRTQTEIPKTIEAVLKGHLSGDYYYYKRRFLSLRLSLTVSMEAVVVAFVIFSYCHFPLSKPGEVLMLVAACSEYGLGAYIIHKLLYAGMMLYSLLTAAITRDLFRAHELDAVNTYVHLISTLAIISVSVHVIGYYRGPFMFGSILGTSMKTFLLLPALLATPLLVILHFYPRAVLQRLYSKSIDLERSRFKKALENEDLSAFEKRYYLIEFEKISQNELRSNRGLTLGDLLLGITVLIMVLGLFLRR